MNWSENLQWKRLVSHVIHTHLLEKKLWAITENATNIELVLMENSQWAILLVFMETI